jgi:hypothetical protein
MSSPSALTTAATPDEHRAAENREADAPQGAGWYESSWELVSGLEVSELLESAARPSNLQSGLLTKHWCSHGD